MDRRSETMHFLTRNELKALLEKAKKDSVRNYAMLLIAYRHGLRASETVNIKVKNVDLDAGNIRCERGKGSISNWQQLSVDEVKALKAWLRKKPKTGSSFLFPSPSGKAMTRVGFFKVFQRLALSVGLPREKCHPHVLKHSLGTHLANAGVPVQVIQQRLGHRNIQSTMVYLSISSGYVDKAFEVALANGAVL